MVDPERFIRPGALETSILILRGQRVMLDASLAALYEVETKRLIESVMRNIDRFPADFMFQLSVEEFENLRSKSATSSQWGGRRHPPYVFTEQGVAMLSSVLRSPRAIAVNIEIMRAFVRLRQVIGSHEELARQLEDLERKYDKQFRVVFDAIRALMTPTPVADDDRERIGFRPPSRRS